MPNSIESLTKRLSIETVPAEAMRQANLVLVSLFMMTTTDIAKMVFGIEKNFGGSCRVFGGITNWYRMLWDIGTGPLLWKKLMPA